MTFYLGTHHPVWLRRLGVPLFLSRRQLVRYRVLPRALAPWGLDSGGFTELSMSGAWRTAPADYVGDVRRFQRQAGNLAFASIQDWMCEPSILQKTGKSVLEHQRLTIENALRLRQLAPEVPWLPVVQGWKVEDYLRHVEMYAEAGIDLRDFPLVGVGSVCRRQGTREVVEILEALQERSLRLHGFGIKISGLPEGAPWLVSADSMAWSFRARRSPPLPGCTHRNCANCAKFALAWRSRILDLLDRPVQGRLCFGLSPSL